MFTFYKILPFTIFAVVLLTMTLVPIFYYMATVKSTKAARNEISLNVPHLEDDDETSYY